VTPMVASGEQAASGKQSPEGHDQGVRPASRRRRPRQASAAVVAGEASAAQATGPNAHHPTPFAPPDPTVAAFFDVDNTIMRGASIFQLARGLYRRKFFTLRDLVGFGWRQLQFQLVGENLNHLQEVQTEALSFVQGHSVAELRAVGEEIFDELIADRIWPGTLALAMTHLEAGQRVWLVTATPVEVADVIAGRLGLTGALGTVAEHVDGVYTGRLVGQAMHGQAKAEAVRALAAREGLDLERCSAYSDSANDIPTLALVGNPCAINPDKALRAHARKHGWRVRDYRKGRQAARIAVPVAAAVAAAAATGLAGVAVGRRLRTPLWSDSEEHTGEGTQKNTERRCTSNEYRACWIV
jgi:HAD superfamily hydrolase (TIGR01490 family)